MLLNESNVSSKYQIQFDSLTSMSAAELICSTSESFANNFMARSIESTVKRLLRREFKDYSPIKVYCNPESLIIFSDSNTVYSVKDYDLKILVPRRKITDLDELRELADRFKDVIKTARISTFNVESCTLNDINSNNDLTNLSDDTEDDYETSQNESSDVELIQADNRRTVKRIANNNQHELHYSILLEENRDYLRAVSTKCTRLFISDLQAELNSQCSVRPHLKRLNNYWNLLYNISIVIDDAIFVKTSINSNKEIQWLVKSKKYNLNVKLDTCKELIQLINKTLNKHSTDIQETRVIDGLKNGLGNVARRTINPIRRKIANKLIDVTNIVGLSVGMILNVVNATKTYYKDAVDISNANDFKNLKSLFLIRLEIFKFVFDKLTEEGYQLSAEKEAKISNLIVDLISDNLLKASENYPDEALRIPRERIIKFIGSFNRRVKSSPDAIEKLVNFLKTKDEFKNLFK